MLDLGTLQAHIKLDGADKYQADLENAATKTDTLGSKIKDGLGKAAQVAAKATVAATAAIGAAVLAVTKQSVSAYAEMEQLEGGMDTLFGDSADKVKQNAQEAFATMGMSANEYMSNVSGFSSALLQSLGGDTEAAAKAANDALTDMADNASIFGSDMESIQNAYQGFAKQNYTMLDNLKLGYGGTKEEMERLLEDAGKLTGEKYDIENLNDVYNAIHAIQVEQGIAGNAANEASKTISGSWNSTKAAWQNLLAGMADPTKDLDQLIDNLLDSASNVVDNVAPVIENVLKSIMKAVPKVGNKIAQMAPQIAPKLITMLRSLATTIVAFLPQLMNSVLQALPGLITMLSNAIVTAIPLIAQAGVKLFGALVKNLPAIISALARGVLSIGSALIKEILKLGKSVMDKFKDGANANLPKVTAWFKSLPGKVISAIGSLLTTIKSKGKDLLTGLKNGVTDKWEDVKKWFSDLPNKAFTAIGGVTDKLKSKGTDFLSGLKSGLTSKWEDVRTWMQDLPSKIKNALGSVSSLLWGAGRDIVQGLIDGLNSKVSSLIDKAKQLGQNIKDNKGPKAYDLKLLVENGQWIMDGLISGIDKSVPELKDTMRGVASTIAGTDFTANARAALTTGIVGTGQASAGTNYNIYINGTQINNDQQIENIFEELMTTMARRGMM